ncbi:MAG: choice-of-anchor J domain-containing protein, partial [Bacteroidales bacterium]|nr:choice-of-anchor J domain-containing protein [Bacteroidales bacterium]
MKKNFMLIGLLLLGSGLTWGQNGIQAQYKMFETQRESAVEVGIGKATPGAVVDADTPLESVREQIKHLTSRRDDLSGVKRPKARAVKAPVQPPYYCTFDNAQVLEDEWIVIDGDADGRSWYYEWKGFFDPCDGNESSGFAAVLWNQDGEANEDWMITAAPVSLPAGTSNISFYYGLAQPFFVEKLRVFYSKTPDTAMEKLTELGEFEIMVHAGWYFAHIDFELPEAGDYYFSFLYQVPDDNQYGVMLDNIRIDKGAFVGTPDLQVERVVLPPASCNLGIAERIGVSLHNVGSTDITKWAMTYSVNGGEPVREVFTETLAEGESKLAYFTQTADLSVAGNEYQVAVN